MRDMTLLSLLLEHADVEILCFKQDSKIPKDLVEQGLSVTSVNFDKQSFFKRALNLFKPYILRGFSQNMRQEVEKRKAPNTFVYISRLAMAQYIPYVKKLGMPVVLDEHNVESHMILREIFKKPWKLYLLPQTLLLKFYEAHLGSIADALVTCSDLDRKILQEMTTQNNLHLIPNCIDLDWYKNSCADLGKTLFCVGTLNYAPNVEGVLWFIKKVIPLLRQRSLELPEVIIAGANPQDSLRKEVETAGVRLVANPPSVQPLLKEARLVFIPLLNGGGTRFKLLEAFSSKKAVVSTSVGAEGIEVTHHEDIMLADNAENFANCIVELLSQPSRCEEMGQKGYDLVVKKYDWRVYRPIMREVLSRLSLK